MYSNNIMRYTLFCSTEIDSGAAPSLGEDQEKGKQFNRY